MQAEDIWLTQSPNPGICPLCSMPLTSKGASRSQRTMITCLSCGFSAPFVKRQHREYQAQEEKIPTTPTSRSAAGSSVWIDPAVSAFLGGRVVDAGSAALGPGNASPPQLSHEPQKPRAKRVNPVTPIPPAASAPQYTRSVRVRPKYRRSHIQTIQDDDVTRIPTVPPPIMWQYESPDFEAESSLSALSLVVDAPTRPEATLPPKTTKDLPHIDEMDTVPPKRTKPLTPIEEIDTRPPKETESQTGIDEMDTVPHLANEQSARALVSANQVPILLFPLPAGNAPASTTVPGRDAISEDPSSWTAGGAAGSAYARRIAERSKGKVRKHNYSFNPLDRLRWWLLHPGRIEFILWLGGTILLLCVTFVFLLASAVSLSWINPGLQNGRGSGALVSGSNSGSHSTGSPTTVTAAGLTLTLLNTSPLIPGQPIYLHGQHFTPRGTVIFTDEKDQPMNLNSRLNSVQADKSGAFMVALSDASWAPGHHQIVVKDVRTGRVARLPVVLEAGLFGKKGTPSSSVTPLPDLTATATPNNGSGVIPTPVSSTPVSTPTVGITPKPSPTPTQVTPTPTMGITPTPSPASTAGVTPTAGTTPTTPTPATSPSAGSGDTQYMAASVGNTAFHSATNLDSWIWLLIAGYAISMLMLGIAGMLKRRQH